MACCWHSDNQYLCYFAIPLVCGKHHRTFECTPSVALSRRSTAAAAAAGLLLRSGAGPQQMSIDSYCSQPAARRAGPLTFCPTVRKSNILVSYHSNVQVERIVRCHVACVSGQLSA